MQNRNATQLSTYAAGCQFDQQAVRRGKGFIPAMSGNFRVFTGRAANANRAPVKLSPLQQAADRHMSGHTPTALKVA